LIWRTVEPPDRARYTEKGMKMLEEREVETV